MLHWLQGHSRIRGNEIVDALAKKGTGNDISINSYLTKEEIMSCLKNRFLQHWNDQWIFTAQMSCKWLDLLNVRDKILQHIPIYKLKARIYEKAVYRLRMGYTGERNILIQYWHIVQFVKY